MKYNEKQNQFLKNKHLINDNKSETMNKKFLHTGLIGLIVAFSACSTGKKNNSESDQAHNSKNALDYYGIYAGTIPCADCAGILTNIAINKDNTYQMTTKYDGKSEQVMVSSGTYSWDTTSSVIMLKEKDSDNSVVLYKVGENTMTKLDMEGKPITGELASTYVLKKMPTDLIGNKWKLIELNGMPLKIDATPHKEAMIVFDFSTLRFSGDGGCNKISGSFILQSGNRIVFSQAISTMMACPDMKIESQLLKVLQATDNYAINFGKDTLSLNTSKMACLARFSKK